MNSVQAFASNFDFSAMTFYLTQAVIALICIVFHEMSHGYAALALGDTTAKRQGRLSFNPLHHIDPLGLLLMMTAGFGWAKPVPIDMRRFKDPKRGMAITALAGPVSNLVMAWAALVVCSLIYHFSAVSEPVMQVFTFFARLALMSVGLAVFNLIPIPPLDGSKVLFSLLPARMYVQILRYERYVTLALFALVFAGALDLPLDVLRGVVLRVLCLLSGLPASVFGLG